MDQTNDKDGLKLLLKRLRKMSSSIYHHRYVWERLCTVYLDLLRRNAFIPECTNMIWDISLVKFNLVATKIEEQLLNGSDLDRYGIDDIRDVLELKKINGGLYNVQIIDQFLIDRYITVYSLFSKEIDILDQSTSDNIGDMLNYKDSTSALDEVSRNDILLRLPFFCKVFK
ncbi:hypothetical protein PCANB_001408 [Pneumocystis canis]|nr:hypothetical protein PCANB_001408 [Pneumocystis canis]